jgi:hypothetical protein
MKKCQRTGLRKLALVGLLLALALVLPAQAQGGGVLEGLVVNGTPGGPSVGADITVKLYVLSRGSEVETRETTTDAEGRFRFEDLDPDPALEYWPEAIYEGTPYSSAVPVQFQGEAQTVSSTVQVYESADDDSALRLNSVHVIAESFGQVLRISEIHMLSNDGATTFAGSGQGPSPGTTVFIPLPAGAVGLAFSEEDPAGRYVEAEGGVWDTQPVTPGQDTSLIFLSYHLMVTNEAVMLERTFAYPVTAFNILVTQPGLSLQSDRLIDQGLQSFQGRQYAFYAAQDLPAGGTLTLNFALRESAEASPAMPGGGSTTPPAGMAPAAPGQQGAMRILGYVLAALAVAAAVAYPLGTGHRRSAAGDGSPPAALANETGHLASPERRRLIEELADLEDAREGGRLDEEVYELRRGQIYQALRWD